MATETTETKTKTTTANGPQAASVASAPERFARVQIDRPSFSPESFLQREEGGSKKEIYKGPALQGYLASFIDLGQQADDDGTLRAMTAYVVVATAPTIGFDRNEERVEVKIGDEIILWPNTKLDQAIQAATGATPRDAATHPTHMVELWILPLSRDPHKSKGGEARRMWTFDVRMEPTPIPRKTTKVALNVLAGVNVPTLASGN